MIIWENINKTDISLVRLTKIKIKITNIKNKIGDITTYTAVIEKIIKEQLYAHKFNNLEEMDQSLKTINYQNLTKIK